MATTTLPINKDTQELLDCMRLLSQVYNRACNCIETKYDNPREADKAVDELIGKPFEDFRSALSTLVGQSIAESLIMDGIPA